jgi:CheY-like chemotaxis protein
MTTQGRILLIDDEHEIGTMLHLFFDWCGYEFFHTDTGAEGLQMASEVMPHMILMDVTLPDTDGFAVTVKLRWRPRTAHIPIIFLTKWNSRDRRLTGLGLGASDYVPKPFNLKELLLRVQNGIARSARENLTDLRTGLPAAVKARDWLAAARTDPEQAIIEVALQHGIPFRNVYGSVAAAAVHRQIAGLLLAAVNRQGTPDDFIGYLDEENWVIVTPQDRADGIARQITTVFNRRAPEHYSAADREQGALVANGATYPFMCLTSRVTAGTGQDAIG